MFVRRDIYDIFYYLEKNLNDIKINNACPKNQLSDINDNMIFRKNDIQEEEEDEKNFMNNNNSPS